MLGRERILSAAYGTLLEQNWHRLPISPAQFRLPFLAISYQEYARLAQIPVSWFLSDPLLCEGCSVIGQQRPPLLLYNAESPPSRQCFTIAHELGHLLLGHAQRDRLEEDEADCFASALLMPDALLAVFTRRGIRLSEAFLVRTFAVSKSAAKNKLLSFSRGFSPHPLDEQIETLFYPALKAIVPLAEAACAPPEPTLEPID